MNWTEAGHHESELKIDFENKPTTSKNRLVTIQIYQVYARVVSFLIYWPFLFQTCYCNTWTCCRRRRPDCRGIWTRCWACRGGCRPQATADRLALRIGCLKSPRRARSALSRCRNTCWSAARSIVCSTVPSSPRIRTSPGELEYTASRTWGSIRCLHRMSRSTTFCNTFKINKIIFCFIKNSLRLHWGNHWIWSGNQCRAQISCWGCQRRADSRIRQNFWMSLWTRSGHRWTR